MKLYVRILYGVLLAAYFHNAITTTEPNVLQLRGLLKRVMKNKQVNAQTKAQLRNAVQIISQAEKSPQMVTLNEVLVELMKLCYRTVRPSLPTLPPGAYCPRPAGAFCQGGVYCLPKKRCPKHGSGVPGNGHQERLYLTLPPGALCPPLIGAYCAGGLYCPPGNTCPQHGPGGQGVDGPRPVTLLPGAYCPKPAGAFCESGVYCLPGNRCPLHGSGVPGVSRPTDAPGGQGVDGPRPVTLPPGAYCPKPAGAFCQSGAYCLPGNLCPYPEVKHHPALTNPPAGPSPSKEPTKSVGPFIEPTPSVGATPPSTSKEPTPSTGPIPSIETNPYMGPTPSVGPSHPGSSSDSDKNYNKNVNNILIELLKLHTGNSTKLQKSLRSRKKKVIRVIASKLVPIYQSECVIGQIARAILTDT
ncbi:collagen alpha-2(I) chain-like isoform X1 [Drosophila guanche]|uniref:collagen alpha-2(I) chain-like isoform X1 n=1 Tax=Drosophila guanche TaxID=7266 RepID=UPI0014721798|nr:collagen alpha-2(I) chain-like isoform X1 [Drosophila guanche]